MSRGAKELSILIFIFTAETLNTLRTCLIFCFPLRGRKAKISSL